MNILGGEVVGVVVAGEELLVSRVAVVAMKLIDLTGVDMSDISAVGEVVVVVVEDILIPREAVVSMDSATVNLSPSSVGSWVLVDGDLVLRESSDSDS